MCSLPAVRRASLVPLALLLLPGPAAGQEPDSLPEVADTLGAPRDTLELPRGNPRLTWLGDTLPPADTLMPKFSPLPEVWADSLVDPYTLDRPGAWPEWVLSGDELVGRGAFNLLDVLQSEVLLLGNDFGGAGFPAFFGSAHGSWTNVQVVVDGVPVGHPLTAGWDLRRLPVEAIARIAWYPGPQGAAWGGSGAGGVLEITTRRHLAPTARSMLGFLAGSADAQAFSGYFGRSITRRGTLFLAANFDDTEGAANLGGGREDFTRNQLVAKAGWRLADGHRVEVSRFSDGLSGDASRANVVGTEDQDASLLHLFYKGEIGPVAARARYWSQELDIGSNFEFLEEPGLVGDSDRSGSRIDVSWSEAGWLGWASAAREEERVDSSHPAFLATGGENLLEPPEAGDSGSPRLVNPRERVEWGGGLGWHGSDRRWGANLAIRRVDWGEAAGSATNWQLEAVGRPVERLTVRGAVGAAHRPAEFIGQALLESFAFQGFEIHPGQPSDPGQLERWSGWRVEAAWSAPGWRIAARAYGAAGEDAFLWVPPGAWLHFDPASPEVRLGELPFNTFDVVNLSISGFEGEIVAPLPWLDLEARIQGRHLSNTEELTGRQIPFVPENQAVVQLRSASRFFPSRDLLLEARLTGRFVGERSVLDEDEPLPEHFVADLLVQGTVINFTIFVSFKNLAGTLYRSEEEFLLPQREGYFGVVWRFRE